VIWLDSGPKHQWSDVGEIGATRLLVDWTLVDQRLSGLTLLQVDREDMYDGQSSIEDLG